MTFVNRRESCVLPEAALDVILGAFVHRVGEDLGAGAVFDQFALEEEGAVVGGAGGLLDRVGDKHDGIFFLEFKQRIFDF